MSGVIWGKFWVKKRKKIITQLILRILD